MKMILIIIFFILVGYFVFSYIRFEYILSHANLPEIKHPDERIGTGPKLKYLAAGDSTAVGQGASNAANTYANKVAQYLSKTNSVEYRNVGVIGATTQDVINKQLSQIIDFDPNIITISIGANDLTHWVSREKIVENYKIIIRELTEKTKAKIYITNVPRLDQAYLLPLPFRAYFNRQARLTNIELLKLETERVKLVDIYSVEVSNSQDQFHPNDQGYEYWTSTFIANIKN